MKPIISPRQMHEGQRSEVGAIRRLERTIELLTKRVADLEAAQVASIAITGKKAKLVA